MSFKPGDRIQSDMTGAVLEVLGVMNQETLMCLLVDYHDKRLIGQKCLVHLPESRSIWKLANEENISIGI